MAVKDSQELKSDERYALGDYSFRIERTSIPGSTNDKIEAICTDKDGKNARKSIQVPSSTQFFGWYVEANEDTADVYITIEKPVDTFVFRGVDMTLGYDNLFYMSELFDAHEYNPTTPMQDPWTHETILVDVWILDEFEIRLRRNGEFFIYAYGERKGAGRIVTGVGGVIGIAWKSKNANLSDPDFDIVTAALFLDDQYNTVKVGTGLNAGRMSRSEGKEESVLIGRFAIELKDAGGVGPGSGWVDPGDYDPDWEEGDPTHTLYVTVTEALSGRHNDPIVDPSYSYIPADKNTVKGYGCGGDGGHGGGGGAGASTVVVHKFATNQANSKEITALARRHGYGSGGGKGGKGGDGCILVYY